MSDHLIAEANRHAQSLPKMQLPTTQPTHRDIAWYADECMDLKKQIASLERDNAALRKILNEADVIFENQRDDGRREWWSGGTWVRPSEYVIIIDKDAIDAAMKEQP